MRTTSLLTLILAANSMSIYDGMMQSPTEEVIRGNL
ncbi:hypothetical protein Cdeb_00081 [Caldibacillus debilis GB1]|uniref:Uncharacterized protein n=1 Tax=Caldibacillus debilis GB1 TaxID=1339248 RepID=A0A420VHZ2_9BACI|nr:hypothetical protein Cdeb_00081 [Caldibacillus debilis GB1]